MKSFIGAVLFICVAFSANAQLLWKVSGNGLNQPSYIIGTHHLAPFSIMDSIAGLQKAMKETQQVYGELKMSEMQSPVTMQKMQQAMMIANDSTLSTLLSPEDFATANKFCKENLMLDLSAAPKLKPAFLLNNVVVAAYVKHIGKFNPQEQLDTFFQSQATQNGKKDAMIYNRNKAWSEKLPAIMKTAPTFIAVGALHLPGDKGLLNLLKKQGYTVEPVK